MAISYATTLRTTRMQDVIDAIDAGAGAGYIEICTTAYATVLATIPLADPCGTAAAGVLTFDTTPAIEDTSADASGDPSIARAKDSDGNVVVSGMTVGTSGTNIILTSASIVATEPVTITSATITEGNA
jgi:hypothetical protein